MKNYKEPKVEQASNCLCQKDYTSRGTVISIFTFLILIPFTILFGVYFLDNRKYYFISSVIILEILIAFFLSFEKRKPQAREIVLISVLSALAVAGRCAFAAIPQFKPVAAIIIISGACFGANTGFLVGAITAFVSNFFFGQTPYTPWQMFAFGVIGFVAGLLFKKGVLKKTKVNFCVFGFLSTLVIYGGVMNFSSVLLFQPNPTVEMYLTTFAMGFPFDVIHSLSTAFFLYLVALPMIEKLNRIKVKYGLLM